MKTLYVHAGLPKNGSSALQVFLAKNSDSLKKEGINYFELESLESAKQGAITSGNGALLSRWMLDEGHEAYYSEGEQIYKSLMQQINSSDLDYGIISSEFFAATSFETLKKWKEELDSNNVQLKFLFYARRQDQYFMSSYMQRVKRHRETKSPHEFIVDSYKSTRFLKYYDYAKSLEEVLGKGNVLPFIFESIKKHPKGLVGHFIQTCLGECPAWIDQDPVINTSPSALEIKFMLMANKFHPRMRFSDFVVEDSVIAGRSTKYKLHAILKPKLVEEILEFYDEQNTNFESEYAQGEKFPEYEPIDYINLDDFQFSQNEVLDIISGFLVRFDRRLVRLESQE